MKVLFSANVMKAGGKVEEGLASNMLITFNEDAPEDYLDYVLTINNIIYDSTELQKNAVYILQINNQYWDVTCWGDATWKNLCELGHMTVIFDGAETPVAYGSLHVKGNCTPSMNDLAGQLVILRSIHENSSD